MNLTLHTLAPIPDRTFHCHVESYRVQSFPSERLGRSRDMKRRLLEVASQEGSIIHNHSLWMMPNLYSGAARRKGRCKLVCSPRGTLSQWARGRSRWKKAAMWQAGQGGHAAVV